MKNLKKLHVLSCIFFLFTTANVFNADQEQKPQTLLSRPPNLHDVGLIKPINLIGISPNGVPFKRPMYPCFTRRKILKALGYPQQILIAGQRISSQDPDFLHKIAALPRQ